MTSYEKEIIKLDKKPLSIFLFIAFLPAWLLFVFPLFINEANTELSLIAGWVSWSLAMWMPGLGAILANRFGEGKKISELRLNTLGKARIYLWAWLAPIALTVAAGFVAWLFGWGKVSSTGIIFDGDLIRTGDIPFIASPLMLVGIFASTVTLAPLFNSLFALGEELGWRGYLLPKLLPLGQFPAMTISGLIWGLWHTPAILMGLNYPGRPILGVGMMIIFSILLGIFFSWLYLKTKSPWAPALSHGTLNAIASLPLIFLHDVDPILGGALTSVSGWIVLGILILVMAGLREIPVKE